MLSGLRVISGEDILLGKKPVDCLFSDADVVAFELYLALENMDTLSFSVLNYLRSKNLTNLVEI